MLATRSWRDSLRQLLNHNNDMAQITFGEFSERIINAHYNNFALPEATITPRFIAGRVAQKIAKAAVKNAYQNSNLSEVTYSNDQFITVFNNCPLLTDSSTGNKYAVMPGTPAGLPMGREIAQISFSGFPNVWCVPESNRYAFISAGLPPIPVAEGIQKFKVENGNIVFENLPPIVNSSVNMKLIGAVLTGDLLLQQVLNVPKDVEDDIFLSILGELQAEYKVQPQTVSTGEPS